MSSDQVEQTRISFNIFISDHRNDNCVHADSNKLSLMLSWMYQSFNGIMKELSEHPNT